MKKFKVIVQSDRFEAYECEANTPEEAQEMIEEDICNGELIEELYHGVWTSGAEPIRVLDVEEIKEVKE